MLTQPGARVEDVPRQLADTDQDAVADEIEPDLRSLPSGDCHSARWDRRPVALQGRACSRRQFSWALDLPPEHAGGMVR